MKKPWPQASGIVPNHPIAVVKWNCSKIGLPHFSLGDLLDSCFWSSAPVRSTIFAGSDGLTLQALKNVAEEVDTSDWLLIPMSPVQYAYFAHCDLGACIHSGHGQQGGLSDWSTPSLFWPGNPGSTKRVLLFPPDKSFQMEKKGTHLGKLGYMTPAEHWHIT